MIKIRKLQEPQILIDNKGSWTSEYLTALSTGGSVPNSIKTRYRHGDIKTRLKEETSGKCAYCESKITHTYPGDIEHLLPKSKFPNLIVQWSNLTLACGECNRRKRDYYDKQQPLINPYVDDPQEHLLPLGTLVMGLPGDRKGIITELRLELNRADLVERRRERIESLRRLANLYASEPDGEIKRLIERELRRELESDKEYAFISRAYVQVSCGINYRK